MTEYKNVFILCTGRCGSKSLIKALSFADKYSVGHESRSNLIGPDKIEYPPFHIEADNRLAWFLGRLGNKYQEDTFYVHLVRQRKSATKSLNARWGPFTILRAFTYGILKTQGRGIEYAEEYYDTVNENISYFLKDQENSFKIETENIAHGFEKLWDTLGLQGDKKAASKTFEQPNNTTAETYGGLSGLKLKLYHFKIACNEFFHRNH